MVWLFRAGIEPMVDSRLSPLLRFRTVGTLVKIRPDDRFLVVFLKFFIELAV
jgi:hypothetical protein